MADCPSIAGCPFFNDKMQDMPGTIELYKKRYCHTDYTTCARFMVREKLGKEKVPANLYPNMKEKALEIIAAG